MSPSSPSTTSPKAFSPRLANVALSRRAIARRTADPTSGVPYPNVESFPSAPRSAAVLARMSRTSPAVRSGLALQTKDECPAIIGFALDVPAKLATVPVGPIERVPVPATNVSSSPKFEKLARERLLGFLMPSTVSILGKTAPTANIFSYSFDSLATPPLKVLLLVRSMS